ncbi:MAG TPA: YidB family protein [Thermoleophilaceae bacterium]
MGVDKILGGLLGGRGGGGGAGDIGSILGGLTGGRGGSGGGGGLSAGTLMTLLPLVLGLLKGGGLEKILGGMRAQGLSSEADSWVGKGDNNRVSGKQVRKAVGDHEVSRIAKEAGVSEDEAAEGIAQLLPGLVDGASPDGEVAKREDVDNAFAQLERSAAEQR